MQPKIVVGVRFREGGRIYTFDPGILHIGPGDYVIVQTSRGLEIGIVAYGPREIQPHELTQPLNRVLRKATRKDIERMEENREEEKKAFRICEEKIKSHNLPMNLVSVEYLFDRSKFVFYFTSETRVDFRDLVKDLASVLHARVELWQIGARDETKVFGGLGICGRPLCCATFLKEFSPVTIKMAKEQSLALNPLKISGVCGRLMCCLRYEYETYREARSRMPKEGTMVETPQGRGRVMELNALKETLLVQLDNQVVVEFPLEEIAWEGKNNQKEDLANAESEAEQGNPPG
ncbi:MAG: stage 0 sporulation family protein [Caldiserica bacterium]|nr:stage 0 sporulation family protein [Caldisericota bacterium]MDH7562243.1 stage 0 sporulation family protein [Caldisericota bacterium]